MEITYTKTSPCAWLSDCGNYRITATGMAPDYKYEAAYRRPDGTRQILGMFDKQASKQNADAAKDACLVHRSFTEGLANND